MKKLLTVATVLALTVSMTGIAVSAHGGHHGRGRQSRSTVSVYYCGRDCSYCDEDGDGICDNCENRRYYCGEDCSFIDVDSDGLCDTCGNSGYYCGNGCFFSDEDGDGICDNCDTKGVCSVKPKAKTWAGHCHH